MTGAAAWGVATPRAARRRAVVVLLLARERERRAAAGQAGGQPSLRPAPPAPFAAPPEDAPAADPAD